MFVFVFQIRTSEDHVGTCIHGRGRGRGVLVLVFMFVRLLSSIIDHILGAEVSLSLSFFFPLSASLTLNVLNMVVDSGGL